jgi:hypothetical protein
MFLFKAKTCETKQNVPKMFSGKEECFYLIQKLMDQSKTFLSGPEIISAKEKRFC